MVADLPQSITSNYPATYRSSLWTAAKYCLWMFPVTFARVAYSREALIPICLLYIIFMICIINYFYITVKLYADRIEYTGAFWGRKFLSRKNVNGYKISRNKISLISQDGKSPIEIDLPSGINKDEKWDTWMRGIPNIDSDEIVKDCLLSDASYQRNNEVHPGVKLASVCMWACVIGLICVLIVPHATHLGIAILIITPWIALMNIKLHHVYNVTHLQTFPNLKNIMTFVLSGFGLAITGYFSRIFFQAGSQSWLILVDSMTSLNHVVVPICAIIFFASTVAVLYAPPQTQYSILSTRFAAPILFSLLVISFGYGYGAAWEINMHAFVKKPKLYIAKVVDVDEQTSQVELGPWGGHKGSIETAVTSHFKKGDIACIWQYQGMLGVSWFLMTPSGSLQNYTDLRAIEPTLACYDNAQHS